VLQVLKHPLVMLPMPYLNLFQEWLLKSAIQSIVKESHIIRILCFSLKYKQENLKFSPLDVLEYVSVIFNELKDVTKKK